MTRKVLIVDDSKLARMAIIKALDSVRPGLGWLEASDADSALALLQIILGVITAHYGVEGNGFFGLRIDEILPYTVTRTWHTQLGI